MKKYLLLCALTLSLVGCKEETKINEVKKENSVTNEQVHTTKKENNIKEEIEESPVDELYDYFDQNEKKLDDEKIYSLTSKIDLSNEFILELNEEIKERKSGWLKSSSIISVIDKKVSDTEVKLISILVDKQKQKQKYKNFLVVEDNIDSKVYFIENQIDIIVKDFNVEKIDDKIVLGILSDKDDKSFISAFIIKNESLESLEIEKWLDESTINLISIDENIIEFSDGKDLEFYKGPNSILFRVDNVEEHLFSLVLKVDEDRSSKEVIYKVLICDKDYEGYLSKDYYMSYYRYIDPDYDLWGESEENYFSEDMKEMLVSNKSILMSKPWRMPLPSEYKILDISSGDLNGDGILDLGVVVEKIPGFSGGERQLYILLSKEKESYEVIVDANHCILGSSEGGVFGDPFEGVYIKDNKLTIVNYGGSSDRWGTTEIYKFIDGRLQKIKEESLEYSTHTLSGTVLKEDYLKGTSNVYSFSQEEELDGLLLDYNKISTNKAIYFDEFNLKEYHGNLDNSKNKQPMPYLYRIRYGEKYWNGELKLKSKEVLEHIKNIYFPDAKKIKYSYSKEILDNYSKLLGYTIPNYYYETDLLEIWYDGLDIGNEEYNKYKVCVKSKEDGKEVVYYVYKIENEIKVEKYDFNNY